MSRLLVDQCEETASEDCGSFEVAASRDCESVRCIVVVREAEAEVCR